MTVWKIAWGVCLGLILHSLVLVGLSLLFLSTTTALVVPEFRKVFVGLFLIAAFILAIIYWFPSGEKTKGKSINGPPEGIRKDPLKNDIRPFRSG